MTDPRFFKWDEKMKIAALFVQKNGPYFDVRQVDPWDEERDARNYNGPWPVVAHPPCARWGRYWSGGPSSPKRYELGDDGGCFAAALAAVRRWGGVLEHPKDSLAWDRFGLQKPSPGEGWIIADHYGYTCCVDQGHYGHRARKPTWLYAINVELPMLNFAPSVSKIKRGPSVRRGVVERMCKREREATPAEFRDILLHMAASVFVSPLRSSASSAVNSTAPAPAPAGGRHDL